MEKIDVARAAHTEPAPHHSIPSTRPPWDLLLFLSLVILYSLALPVGDAPDEPAHLIYLQSVLSTGTLPEVPGVPGEFDYEAHQQPLAYLLAAAQLRAIGWDDLRFAPRKNPAFDFNPPPKPYLLPVLRSTGPRLARLTNLPWAILFAIACKSIASHYGSSAFGIASLFLYSPQILFLFSSFNNDAAAIAVSTTAVAALLDNSRKTSRWSIPGALAFALAPLTKLTALFLGVPLLVALALENPRRRPLLLMAASFSIGSLLAVALHLTRVVGPSIAVFPEGWSVAGGSVQRLLLEPQWLASAWLSYWAKLGWLNVRLPPMAYLWFLAPTALGLLGLIRPTDRNRRTIALSGLLTAGLLLATFMVLGQWQPQGRLLLPTVGFAVALAGDGFLSLALTDHQSSLTARALWIGSLTLALVGWMSIGAAYQAD